MEQALNRDETIRFEAKDSSSYKLLMKLYEEEINSALSFLKAAICVNGPNSVELNKWLKEGVKESFEHARMIGSEIFDRWKVVPEIEVKGNGTQVPSPNVMTLLSGLLEEEKKVLKSYIQLKRVSIHTDNHDQEELARELIQEESRHIRVIERLTALTNQ